MIGLKVGLKLYPIMDRIPLPDREALGLGIKDNICQPMQSIGMAGGKIRGTDLDIRAARIGEYRRPQKGEWFLSGAIPEAYRAPNDLGTKYYILRLVKVRTTTIVKTEIVD